MRAGDWTWLEIVKLALGVLTPLTIFGATYFINDAVRDAEAAGRRAEAVQELAQDIWDRQIRAAMLVSGLERHAAAPTATSLEEVVARKAAYDAAFVAWNRRGQSNLLVVRSFTGERSYGALERLLDQAVVGRGLAPLDACVTEAYDVAIREGDPRSALTECDAAGLIGYVRTCGAAFIEALHRLSAEPGADAVALLAARAGAVCAWEGVPNPRGRLPWVRDP